jgi:hypothetical protein
MGIDMKISIPIVLKGDRSRFFEATLGGET